MPALNPEELLLISVDKTRLWTRLDDSSLNTFIRLDQWRGWERVAAEKYGGREGALLGGGKVDRGGWVDQAWEVGETLQARSFHP